MVAVAGVRLDAWERRYSNRHLRALRYAFLGIAAIAVGWQTRLENPSISPGVALGVALYLPRS